MIRTAARRSHYITTGRTNSTDGSYAHLIMGDIYRQLFHRHSFRAFDRGTCHSAGMSSHPASQIVWLIAPAPNYQCFIRNPFRHRHSPV